jgi:signal transduction histidine kinase
MIKKLRVRFIIIAMFSVIFVLGIIIATINISNYRRIDEESNVVLDVLCENNGRFPNANMQEQPPKPDNNNVFSAETPYESRYFSVTISSEGQVVYTDVNQIAAITAQDAAAIAKELYDGNKTSGYYGDYKFRATESNSSSVYIFLDCSRNLSTFRNFLYISLIISAIGVALVFMLVIVFSRVVFIPVVESYAKQKMFITNASHDIKTPLTIINADTEVVELTNGESEWTTDIKKQIVRLTSLTDKLVFLSRMEEANVKLDMQQFNLSDVLDEMCRSYSSVAISRGYNLELDIEENVTFCGNEQMIRQAIALLMDNAVKYTSENGNIKITLKRKSKGCTVIFKNDVQNIEKGNCNNLFERFYRGDKSRNSETGGNGIGLSVVKAIIEAHRGKINATSQDGKSLEFNINL